MLDADDYRTFRESHSGFSSMVETWVGRRLTATGTHPDQHGQISLNKQKSSVTKQLISTFSVTLCYSSMFQVFSQVSVSWFYRNLCLSPEFLSQSYDSPAERSRSLPRQYKIGLQCFYNNAGHRFCLHTECVECYTHLMSASVSAGVCCPLQAWGSTCFCRDMKRHQWSWKHWSLLRVSCCAQGL